MQYCKVISLQSKFLKNLKKRKVTRKSAPGYFHLETGVALVVTRMLSPWKEKAQLLWILRLLPSIFLVFSFLFQSNLNSFFFFLIHLRNQPKIFQVKGNESKEVFLCFQISRNSCLEQWVSKRGPWTGNIYITWKLVRNPNSWASSQIK